MVPALENTDSDPCSRFLGPGFITTNVDNDPGGIFTYSQAGAQFGYSLLADDDPYARSWLSSLVQRWWRGWERSPAKGLSDLIRRRVRSADHRICDVGHELNHEFWQYRYRVRRHRRQHGTIRRFPNTFTVPICHPDRVTLSLRCSENVEKSSWRIVFLHYLYCRQGSLPVTGATRCWPPLPRH